MKYLSIVLAFVLFISCKREESYVINNFKGYYIISSIELDQPLDINNDGYKSNNYLSEIMATYIDYKGEMIDFGYLGYDISNNIEATPLYDQTSDIQTLNINFPYFLMDSLMVDGRKEVFATEITKMNTSYTYKLIRESVELDDVMGHSEYYGIYNLSLNRLSSHEFEMFFEKDFYDYSDKQWKRVKVRSYCIKNY